MPLASSVQPFHQELSSFFVISLDAGQVVSDAIVGVMASQLGFGCFPEVRCLHRPGASSAIP